MSRSKSEHFEMTQTGHEIGKPDFVQAVEGGTSANVSITVTDHGSSSSSQFNLLRRLPGQRHSSGIYGSS